MSEESTEHERVNLQAWATDQARVFQARRDLYVAQRDLHLHYISGVRRAHRADAREELRECPYPGLAEFGTEQSRWFFGRDEAIADLMVALSARFESGGLLAVVAPSGTGKSSLLKAGLLPAIRRGSLGIENSSQWPHVLFTPTARPLQELVERLQQEPGLMPTPEIEQDLTDPTRCANAVRDALRRRAERAGTADQRLVVVVDQFEELFTQCADEHTRRSFLDVLSALSNPGDDGEPPAALVVYGLRSDFYTQCVDHSELHASLQSDQVLIGPLSEEGLREAIECPAQDVGLEIEPGLVEILLRDLGRSRPTDPEDGAADLSGSGGYEAGRLPLLAHALRVAWHQKAGNVLTVDGYRAAGGIDHAITSTAEKCYRRLSSSEKRLTREVFMRLVKIGDGVPDVRRRLPRSDLLRMSSDAVAAAGVIDTFTEGRLLVQGQDVVEITHEALLSTWIRLRRWIDEDRTGHILRQRLEDSASDWLQNRRDTGTLYRGGRLEQALSLAASPGDGLLSADATAFVTASLRFQKRGVMVRRAVLSVLSVLALVASTTAFVAFQQRTEARTQRDVAISQRVMVEANRLRPFNAPLAAALDVAGHRRHADTNLRTHLFNDAGSLLFTSLVGKHKDAVSSVATSPGKGIIASSGFDRSLKVWRTAGEGAPRPLGSLNTGHENFVSHVSFNPDGNVLVSVSVDQVRLWDLSHPDQPSVLSWLDGDRAGSPGVARFSPDGRVLAIAGDDGTVTLWDVTDPVRPERISAPLTGHSKKINQLDFSPDGRTLATASNDETVRLWDVTDPVRPGSLGQPLTAHKEAVHAVAFGSGGVLASAGGDKTVRLWDMTDPGRPKQLGDPLTGHTDWIGTVAFSPDGSTLASGGADQTLRLWNVVVPRRSKPLGQPVIGHTGTVGSIAFLQDGRKLVSAGGLDRNVLLWSVPDTVISDHVGVVLSVAFSPDGETLVSAGMDRSLLFRNISNPYRPGPALRAPVAHSRGDDKAPEGVGKVQYGPDGRTLASVGTDGSVQFWDMGDVDHPHPAGFLLTRHAKDIKAIALSADLRMAACSFKDGSVRLWDISDPAHPEVLGHAGAKKAPPYKPGSLTLPFHRVVWGLKFSPDGRFLAGIGPDKALRVWNTSDPARPRPVGRPLNHSGGVQALQFSPDGRTLASVSGDNRLRLWAPGNPNRVRQLNRPLPFHGVYSMAFSPDGHTLASAGIDHTVRLWDVGDPARPGPIGRPLVGHSDSAYAVAFSPDGETLASAGLDKTVRLWGLDAEKAARRICAATGRTLTERKWEELFPGIDFVEPCH
ncbi:AAA family ATPase [Streptomyces olindensis]|uniref:AAA family ATPase n=1 Tax=Streptomyces olindensis TaxID=358823 RepID=A0ABV2Y0N1_9ACTN